MIRLKLDVRGAAVRLWDSVRVLQAFSAIDCSLEPTYCGARLPPLLTACATAYLITVLMF
jgi:hypothetical protein